MTRTPLLESRRGRKRGPELAAGKWGKAGHDRRRKQKKKKKIARARS